MTIGWTQNVVILEAELTLQEKVWYIQAVRQFGWSKLELQRKITANAYLEIFLDFTAEVCYTEKTTPRWSKRAMAKILFICHGNICRSPMDEFVMKDLVKKAGLESQFHIESAATSTEEIGNPVYPPRPPQAGRTRHRLPGSRRPTAPQQRLRPRYTGDFEATWRDVLAECQGLLDFVKSGEDS